MLEKSCTRTGGAKVLNLNNPALAGCHGIRNQHWMAGGDGDEQANEREQQHEANESHEPLKYCQPEWT